MTITKSMGLKADEGKEECCTDLLDLFMLVKAANETGQTFAPRIESNSIAIVPWVLVTNEAAIVAEGSAWSMLIIAFP